MKRAGAGLLALWLVLTLLLSGCQPDAPTSGQSFRLFLAEEPKQLDPQMTENRLNETVLSSLFEGLTRLNEEGEPVPGAAAFAVSSDGLTYTFTLREAVWACADAKSPYHGAPVTADDFVFGLRRVIDPTAASPLAYELSVIENASAILRGELPAEALGVRAVDDQTLEIRLSAPDDSFLKKAAGRAFYPCHEAFFKACAGRYGLEAGTLLTNGAFYLASWIAGESLLLTRHEGYPDKQEVLPDSVRLVFKAPTNPLAALQAGTLDAAPLSREQADTAVADGMTVTPIQDTLLALFFQNQTSVLQNVSVRRALRGGLVFDAVKAQLSKEGETPADGFFPPDMPLGSGTLSRDVDSSLDFSSLDEEPRALLREGLKAMELSSCPQLTVLCADDAPSVALAEIIVQSWQKQLGLYFSLTPVKETTLLARLRAGQYEIALACFTPFYGELGAAVQSLADEDGTDNPARYTSAAFSALAADCCERETLTAEDLTALEAQMAQDCPFVPLAFPTRFFGFGATVTGLRLRTFMGGAGAAPYDFHCAKKAG